MILFSIFSFLTEHWEFTVSSVIGLISLLITILAIFVPKWQAEKKIKDNLSIIDVHDIVNHPKAILAERGEEKNGFDDAFYYVRPAQNGELSFDDRLSLAIRKSPITIVCGTYGMGKSRTVYEYLKNGHSNIFRRVAVLSSEDGPSCSLEEFGKYLEKKIAKPDTLIFIDNIHNRKKEKDQPVNWNEWIDKVFSRIIAKKGKIVITCIDNPTEENGEPLKERLSDIKKEFTTIDVPPVDRVNMHPTLKGHFQTVNYSPIVGNYVDSMENFERIYSRNPLKHNELLLLSVYIFLSPYFYDRGKQLNFIRRVYKMVCEILPEWCDSHLSHHKSIGEKLLSELRIDDNNSSNDSFALAWDSLSQTRNILSGNDMICTIQDNIFVSKITRHICEETYVFENKYNADDVLKLFCAMLMANRKHLIYQQEEWFADLIISIDKETPEYYCRPVTRATGHNERLIANYVKSRFDHEFFDCVCENNSTDYHVSQLKEQYKVLYNKPQESDFKHEIHRAIGIIISRKFRNWQDDLNDYTKAGLSINNDIEIISELLRIAADKRSSKNDCNSVTAYIQKHMGLDRKDLAEMAKSNIRIAVNYENICTGISKERMLSTLHLFSENITKLDGDYKLAVKHKNEDQKIQLDTERKYLYRSLMNWTKFVAAKINTDYQRLVEGDCALQEVLSILCDADIQKEIHTIQQIHKEYLFFNKKTMGIIAQNIHLCYPLCYIDIYKNCINILKDYISSPFILTERSLDGFFYSADLVDGVKIEKGMLAEIDSVQIAIELIDTMRNKTGLNLVDDHNLYTDSFYVNCLFKLISKISYANDEISKRNDFQLVQNYIDNIFGSQNVNTISIGSRRKIYNNLLKYAPWEDAIKLIHSDFLSVHYDMYTINAFFSSARNAYKQISGKKSEESLRDSIIEEILEKEKWVSTKKEALVWGQDTINILESIKVTGKYKAAYDEMINRIKEECKETRNELTKVLEWKNLSLQKTNDLLYLLQNFIDTGSYDEKIREHIRTFTSDNITNLLGKNNDLYNKFVNGKGIHDSEKRKFSDEKRAQLYHILETLRALTWPENGRETIDRYFAPKIYYYDQVRTFANPLSSDTPDQHIVDDRWIFFERAIERLAESEQALVISDDELKAKGKNMQNLLENLVGLGTFEESIILAERAKEKAKMDIYREIYRPLVVKMLCNKLKNDLPQNDIVATQQLKERIIRLNALIADPELILAFDNINASIIMRANTYLRRKNPNPKFAQERFFKDLDQNISIQLPIASSNNIVRHKAWDIYEAQDYIEKLNISAIKFFTASEMGSLVTPIYNNEKDINFDYLFKAMKLLCRALDSNQKDKEEAIKAIDYIRGFYEVQFIQWCKENRSDLQKETLYNFLSRGGATVERLEEFNKFFEILQVSKVSY